MADREQQIDALMPFLDHKQWLCIEVLDALDALAALDDRPCSCGHTRSEHREVTIGSDSKNPPREIWCERCSCIDYELEAAPTDDRCPNPRCVDGWIPYEPNESGAAPPIACRHEWHRRAAPTDDWKITDDQWFEVASALRDWIHGQPWSECGPGSDTCPDWPKAFEIRDVVRAALNPSAPDKEA